MAEGAAPISKGEADYLYELPKQLAGPVQWDSRADGSRYLVLPVIGEDGTPMTIRGWVSRKFSPGKPNRYGFALVVRNSVIIRRWDYKPGHLDPVTNSRMKGPHKHYPDERFADSPSYPVSEVRSGDPDGALVDFLKECRIAPGPYPIHTQTSMEDFP
ncbi:MAG: hypothetical protein ACLQD8_04325 [Thermoplasmata archaeon]